MPKFFSLTDAINYNIDRSIKDNTPAASPSSIYSQNLPAEARTSNNSQGNVFRWGFSTWGVETITGLSKPEDIIDG